MIYLSILFLLMYFGVAAATKYSQMEVLRSTPVDLGKKTILGLSGVFALAWLFNNTFFYAEPGYIYHVRTITGQEKVVDDVGYNLFLFGRVNEWKKAMTVQAKSGDDDDVSFRLPEQRVMFLDQVDGTVSYTVRFSLPTDEESFLKIAHEYRTPENLLRTSLIPSTQETMSANASQISAEDYYAGGRTSFNNEYEAQMKDGIYIVQRREVTERSERIRLGSANAAKGEEQDKYEDDDKMVFVVQRMTDKDGLPLRKAQKFLTYGIRVVEARVTDLQPNNKFVERMQLKQKASADRAIAREQRIQEEEQRLLAIAKGEREVAERQASAKVNQIEKTTDAETSKQLAVTESTKLKEQAAIEKDTAAINLKKARIEAETIKTLADAEAYQKKAIIQADNALKQKLDAYVKAQEVWANAFANRKVPTTVFGATGAGKDNDVQAFMDIMTMKAAKDLNFNPGIAK